MTNFIEHFLDESHGSGYPDESTRVVAQGDYLCFQTADHPVHVYQLVANGEPVHPAIAQMEHNGRMYKLAWIEDDKW
jgi:hypothetical protein